MVVHPLRQVYFCEFRPAWSIEQGQGWPGPYKEALSGKSSLKECLPGVCETLGYRPSVCMCEALGYSPSVCMCGSVYLNDGCGVK